MSFSLTSTFAYRQNKEISYRDALLYAGGIFLLNGLQALTSSQYYVIAYHNAMKIRVAICGLMYRKVNINKSSLQIE